MVGVDCGKIFRLLNYFVANLQSSKVENVPISPHLTVILEKYYSKGAANAVVAESRYKKTFLIPWVVVLW